MSLLEVLLAGLLFFGSSGASLLLWSGAVATMQADARRSERLESLESELQAIEIRLRDPQLLASPERACDQARAQLVGALEREPAVAGVTRQILGPEPQRQVRVRLVALELERERTYDPAAFGGCTEGAGGSESAAGDTLSPASPLEQAATVEPLSGADGTL